MSIKLGVNLPYYAATENENDMWKDAHEKPLAENRL